LLYKIGLKFLRNWFWLYITWKNEQKILIWHFGIRPGQCTSDRREYKLSLCPIKGAGFWKNSLTKVMEIFNNYYAENSFRGMCTVQKISVWHFSFLTVSFIFVLEFDFGSDSCVNKFGICLLALCKKILGWHFGILTLSYTTHFPLFWTWFWFCFRQLC
jgi:hypothetical protein